MALANLRERDKREKWEGGRERKRRKAKLIFSTGTGSTVTFCI